MHTVGSKDWELAGGPPLTCTQTLGMLSSAALVLAPDFLQRFRYWLSKRGLGRFETPKEVNLSNWTPPDSKVAREAETYLRDVSNSTEAFINHSFRTYYFAGVMYELSGETRKIDKEALYVAALMHDVGIFETPRPERERCFTVGGAREARRIAMECGSDEEFQDKIAAAITTNLNVFVPIEEFGTEAHFMRVGGLVELIAQEWKVHPRNIAEILSLYTRDGFIEEAMDHIRMEARENPRGRFWVLAPVLPALFKFANFSEELKR